MSDAPAIITRAIMAAPQTQAPPQFNGIGWLAAFNLGSGTGAMWIGAMIVVWMVAGLIRWRREPFGHLVNVLQWTVLLGAGCYTLRSGGVALQSWAWNPNDVATNAWALTIKGYVDPIAMVFGMAAAALGTLAWDSILEKLSSSPPEPMVQWARWPKLKRPAAQVVLAFIAAIAVVSFR